MQRIDTFSLTPHEGPRESWPTRSELLRDGQPTGRTVEGYLIEAQYRCGERFLIVVSQDCPFEESNDFLLFDRDLKLLSKRFVGMPFSTYLILEHAPLGPDAVRFVTANGFELTVTVRERRPVWIGPLLGLRSRRLPASG